MENFEKLCCPKCGSNCLKNEEIEQDAGVFKSFTFKVSPKIECLECNTFFDHSKAGLVETEPTVQQEQSAHIAHHTMHSEAPVNKKAMLLFGVLATVTLVQWILLWNTL